jgi:hypothetical protein
VCNGNRIPVAKALDSEEDEIKIPCGTTAVAIHSDPSMLHTAKLVHFLHFINSYQLAS